MRVLYIITNLEQEAIAYNQQQHAETYKKYCQIQVSKQRAADQYGAILRNNLIPEMRLNIIKT